MVWGVFWGVFVNGLCVVCDGFDGLLVIVGVFFKRFLSDCRCVFLFYGFDGFLVISNGSRCFFVFAISVGV